MKNSKNKRNSLCNSDSSVSSVLKKKPPKIAQYLLKKILAENIQYSAMNDIEEEFNDIQVKKNRFTAVFWYFWQIITLIPKFTNLSIYWRIAMFKNYLKIAFRHLKKHKSYSFINIGGLVLGIACCILIFTYVNYELSFDKFHGNSERIYRIAAEGKVQDKPYTNARIPAPMAPLLLKDYPEIKNAVRFTNDIFNMFRYKDNKFYEPNFLYTDNSVFEIFGYSLIKGDKETALTAPNTLVITQKTANKYFGNEDPMGKILKFNDTIDLTVTGILKEPPPNSHLKFNMLLSFGTFEKDNPYSANSLTYSRCYTYILLKKGTNIEDFEKKLTGFYDRTAGELLKPYGAKITAFTQPLTSIHLHSNLQNELPGNVNVIYIYIFSIIGVLILLIACINYVNLSTARSAVRAKEVGMRKVLGAFKGQLTKQFFGESFLHVILAFLCGIILVILVFPVFKDISGSSLSMDNLKEPLLIAELLLTMLFVSFVSGIYPAFFLSGFKPVKTLKWKFSSGRGKSLFRNSLVIIQLTISITLIIMTIGVVSQLDFLKNRTLGFDKEHLLSIKFHNDHSDNDNRLSWINSIRDELISLDGVINASLCNHVPGTNYYQNQYIPEDFPKNQYLNMESYNADENFLNTLGIKIVEGRGFSREFSGDAENAVIINKTAVKQAGWTEPVGKKISRQLGSGLKTYQVIGVIEDFHTRSLHYQIEPLFLSNFPDFHNLAVRIKPENITHTMKLIEEKWKKFEPDHPFEYIFADDIFDNLYKTEKQMGKIIRIFTMLAIFIGCLGLFGLVSYVTEQRTKEIGIRKVFGAASKNIVILITKGFMKWVILASIIASPVSYFALDNWLRNFAYRINIGIWMFLLAGFSAFTITILTVSYQTVKSAIAKPIDAIRYE